MGAHPQDPGPRRSNCDAQSLPPQSSADQPELQHRKDSVCSLKGNFIPIPRPLSPLGRKLSSVSGTAGSVAVAGVLMPMPQLPPASAACTPLTMLVFSLSVSAGIPTGSQFHVQA